MRFAYGVAVVPIILAIYMYKISTRSRQQRMGMKGPGIRTPETLASLETWKAAQLAAAPLLLYTAITLAVAAILALGLGAVDAPKALIVVVPVVVGLAGTVFFLGVATVRARHAAAAIVGDPPPSKPRPPKKRPPGRRR